MARRGVPRPSDNIRARNGGAPASARGGLPRRADIWRYLRYCAVPALVFYALSLLALTQAGFGALEILRDPPQITGQSSLLGFLSNVGVWFWVSAAAICLSRLATDDIVPARRRAVLFLGVFSLILACDDLFMIHDRFLAEGILVPLYALALGIFLYRCRAFIRAAGAVGFFLTGVALALSVAVDAVQESVPISYVATQIVEEGFKFLGGATWLYFCILAASASGRRRPAV